jgi:hypothetical protein
MKLKKKHFHKRIKKITIKRIRTKFEKNKTTCKIILNFRKKFSNKKDED